LSKCATFYRTQKTQKESNWDSKEACNKTKIESALKTAATSKKMPHLKH
jgi:hypothetical protein